MSEAQGGTGQTTYAKGDILASPGTTLNKLTVGLDGEALTLHPPLRFDSLPGALRVRVPRHSAGASPAWGTVPLTRKNLGALIQIAAGKPAAAKSGKV